MAASQRRHSSLLTVAGARAGAAVAKSPRSSRAAPNWSSSVALAPTPYPTPTAPMRPSPQRGAVRLGPSAALPLNPLYPPLPLSFPLANEIANLSVPPPPTPKLQRYLNPTPTLHLNLTLILSSPLPPYIPHIPHMCMYVCGLFAASFWNGSFPRLDGPSLDPICP